MRLQSIFQVVGGNLAFANTVLLFFVYFVSRRNLWPKQPQPVGLKCSLFGVSEYDQINSCGFHHFLATFD